MNFMRAWRRMPPLVASQTVLLRNEIGHFLDKHRLPVLADAHRECTLFILWSVHIGVMNMRPGISQNLLLWLHKHKIKRMSKTQDHHLIALYERRLIESLFVINNIFVEQTDHGLTPPLGRRFAKMFLKNLSTQTEAASVDLLDEVLFILRRRSSACAGRLLIA